MAALIVLSLVQSAAAMPSSIMMSSSNCPMMAAQSDGQAHHDQQGHAKAKLSLACCIYNCYSTLIDEIYISLPLQISVVFDVSMEGPFEGAPVRLQDPPPRFFL